MDKQTKFLKQLTRVTWESVVGRGKTGWEGLTIGIWSFPDLSLTQARKRSADEPLTDSFFAVFQNVGLQWQNL